MTVAELEQLLKKCTPGYLVVEVCQGMAQLMLLVEGGGSPFFVASMPVMSRYLTSGYTRELNAIQKEKIRTRVEQCFEHLEKHLQPHCFLLNSGGREVNFVHNLKIEVASELMWFRQWLQETKEL